MKISHWIFFFFFIVTVSSHGELSPASSLDPFVRVDLLLPPEVIDSKGIDPKQINPNGNNSDLDSEKVVSSVFLTYGRGYDQAVSSEKNVYGLRLSRAIGENCLRVDTGYLNLGDAAKTEGRQVIADEKDGVYMQLTCKKGVFKKLAAEFSVGPYFSMNTTTPPGGSTELDQKGLNVLVTAALEYYVGDSGLSLRFECSAVGALDHQSSSLECMAGVGHDFDGKMFLDEQDSQSRFSIETGVVWAKTNHQGTVHGETPMVEITNYQGPWMLRASTLATGNDGAVNNQKGVALEADYRVPINDSNTSFL